MLWQVPKIWDEGEVWIIGGGPSLVEQFDIPKEIVDAVYKKIATPEIYSPYLSQLYDKHTIGVNAAYKLGKWIDIIFFGDKGFFLQNLTGIAEYPAIRVHCHPNLEKHKWLKYVQRDPNKNLGLTENPKKVSWNLNSGAAAISLAVHLGAKRIILLGFDMCLSEGDHQHWHKEYQPKTDKKTFHYPFNRHLRAFPFIAKDAKKLGIEILNASPNSKITEFKKVTAKELL